MAEELVEQHIETVTIGERSHRHGLPGGRPRVRGAAPAYTTDDLYAVAVRLFRTRKPIIAAVQGAAIGGGLGLALAADFRIAAPEARFSANFARLGFHQGFGLSVTLPALVGQQRAAELLYTGRRTTGDFAEGARAMAERRTPNFTRR